MKNLKLQLGVDKNSRGSALLITLLLLGVLMTLTLSISSLVIREIRVTQSVVDANKAYYASEAGVENALLKLKTGGEGAEPQGKFVQKDCALDDANCEAATSDFSKIDSSFAYQYKVSNKASEVPGFDEKNPIYVETVAGVTGKADDVTCQVTNAKNAFAVAMSKGDLYKNCPRATYRKLGLNETHIIPLFSVDDASGTPVSVDDFKVEYYLNFTDGGGLYGEFNGLNPSMFDVLRWKIYGKPKYGAGVQRTESIADFYPAAKNNGPTSPICIGTDATVNAPGNVESCIYPTMTKVKDNKGSLSDNLEAGLWSSARECYHTDAGNLGVFGDPNKQIAGTAWGDELGCLMKDFIANHNENYLVLTNMVNPNVVGITDTTSQSQLARADIYYRIVTKNGSPASGSGTPPSAGGTLVKDYAEINSSGIIYKGGSEQPSVVKDLLVKYKPPKFLQVFNFSLYKICNGEYVDGICNETP